MADAFPSRGCRLPSSGYRTRPVVEDLGDGCRGSADGDGFRRPCRGDACGRRRLRSSGPRGRQMSSGDGDRRHLSPAAIAATGRWWTRDSRPPGPPDDARSGEEVVQEVPREHPQGVKQPRAEGLRLPPHERPAMPRRMHSEAVGAPRTKPAPLEDDDGLPGVVQPVGGRRNPSGLDPRADARRLRAERQEGPEGPGRGGKGPAVVGGQPTNQGRVIDFAGVGRLLPVVFPGRSWIGRIGVGEPERPLVDPS